MNLKELYQGIILDHGKNPRNLRKTGKSTKKYCRSPTGIDFAYFATPLAYIFIVIFLIGIKR